MMGNVKTQVKSLCKKKEGIEQQLQQVEESIWIALKENGEVVKGCQEIIDYLYWETNLPVAGLAEALELDAILSHIVTKPREVEIDVACWVCNKPGVSVVQANNRTEMRDAKKKKISFCPECLNKAIEIYEKEIKPAEAEKEEQQQQEEKERVIQKQEHQARLKYMPYAEYLESEHWKDFRQKALKRAEYRCQLCNSSGKLNVHHRTYENRGSESHKDVIVLCESCHSVFHDKLQECFKQR